MDFLTMDDLKEGEWYQQLPQIIKEAVEERPPLMYYSLNGKQCYIISYEEPENGKYEDVTVMVQKTGVGGPLASIGLSSIDTNRVFDVKLEDLKVWIDNQTDTHDKEEKEL